VKRLLLTGGGTGGHVYPALALGEAFLAGGDGREVLFVGSHRGLEARIVPAAGLPFRGLTMRGFRGKGLGERLLFPGEAALATLRAAVILRRFRPDAVLATGSFASLPVLAAARLLRLPYFLQEQNSVPGQVIRLFAPGARGLFLAFPEAAARLSGRPPRRVTGNPVRAAIRARARRRRAEGPPPGPRRLLIFGGSRGARRLNEAACEALPRLARHADFEALLQTGEADAERIRAALADLGPRVQVRAYIENMPEEMARSHWVICRSGAMTLAEITLMGLPAVLVPFPHAVDDHQTLNARALVDAGAAVLVPDAELDGAGLADLLERLWEEPEREEAMARASRSLGRPEATAEILAGMEKTLAGPGGR